MSSYSTREMRRRGEGPTDGPLPHVADVEKMPTPWGVAVATGPVPESDPDDDPVCAAVPLVPEPEVAPLALPDEPENGGGADEPGAQPAAAAASVATGSEKIRASD